MEDENDLEEFDDIEEFDYEDDSQEDLFRENPLKAIWIKLKEIEEKLNDN